MARNQHEDAIFNVLEAHGIHTYHVGRRKKHPAVEFLLPDGRARFFLYSGTSSDHRSVLNHIRDLKRMLRELGCVPVAEKVDAKV